MVVHGFCGQDKFTIFFEVPWRFMMCECYYLTVYLHSLSIATIVFFVVKS